MIALRIILDGSHVIRGLSGLHKVTDLLSRFRAVGSVLAALLITIMLGLHLDHYIRILWDETQASGFGGEGGVFLKAPK